MEDSGSERATTDSMFGTPQPSPLAPIRRALRPAETSPMLPRFSADLGAHSQDAMGDISPAMPRLADLVASHPGHGHNPASPRAGYMMFGSPGAGFGSGGGGGGAGGVGGTTRTPGPSRNHLLRRVSGTGRGLMTPRITHNMSVGSMSADDDDSMVTEEAEDQSEDTWSRVAADPRSELGREFERLLRAAMALPRPKAHSLLSKFMVGVKEGIRTLDTWGTRLPAEVLGKIARYLRAADVASASLACRSWYAALMEADKDAAVWRTLYARDFGRPPGSELPGPSQAALLQLDHPPEAAAAGGGTWREAYARRFLTARNWRQQRYTVQEIVGHTTAIMALDFDERCVVTGSQGNHVKVFSLETRLPVFSYKGHIHWVRTVQIHEGLVYSGCADRTIRIWDLATGACVRVIQAHERAVMALQVRGRHLVSGSGDTTIKVWDAATGECLRTLAGHTVRVSCIAFDDKHIASGSHDRTVRLWDFSTGDCVKILRGHEGSVKCIALGPDVIVSGSSDHSVLVWGRGSGRVLCSVVGHVSPVLALQLRGKRLVTAGEQGPVYVWGLEGIMDGPAPMPTNEEDEMPTAELVPEVFRGSKRIVVPLITLAGHGEGGTQCLKFDDDKIVSAGGDCRIRIFSFTAPPVKFEPIFSNARQTRKRRVASETR